MGKFKKTGTLTLFIESGFCDYKEVERTVGTCGCGEELLLIFPLDNECLNCGTHYNMSGLEVHPGWKCDAQGILNDLDFGTEDDLPF